VDIDRQELPEENHSMYMQCGICAVTMQDLRHRNTASKKKQGKRKKTRLSKVRGGKSTDLRQVAQGLDRYPRLAACRAVGVQGLQKMTRCNIFEKHSKESNTCPKNIIVQYTNFK
jgi:hypothetical protein